MSVETLTNGQIVVKHENLTLTQTIIHGVRFNDCSIKFENYSECASEYDLRFQKLFIALHNYKCNF